MPAISPEIERFLSSDIAPIPLSQAGLTAIPEARNLRAESADQLFPGSAHPQAALAGILLRFGCWKESHEVAQDIPSAEGSYWHGIVHRVEPDSSNAGYWFRRVGTHPVFPDLFRRAADVLKDHAPKHWTLKKSWDPFLFIEWCDEAREAGGVAAATAVQIQMIEWELLFHWCSGPPHKPAF